MKLITDGNPNTTKIFQDNGDVFPGVCGVEFKIVPDDLTRFRVTLEFFDLFCDIEMQDEKTEFTISERTLEAMRSMPLPALKQLRGVVDALIDSR